MKVKVPQDIFDLLKDEGVPTEDDCLLLDVEQAGVVITWLESSSFDDNGNYRQGRFDAITALNRALDEAYAHLGCSLLSE